MKYTLFASPSGHRSIRKLSPDVQTHLKVEIASLSENPSKGEQLKGKFRFLRSPHTVYQGTHYRVIYEIVDELKEIHIHFAASRENIYKSVSRLPLIPHSR